MTIIRRATPADKPAILRMCRGFYLTTEYAPLVVYNEDTVGLLVDIITEKHLMLVAESGEPDHLDGFVAMMYCPFSFNANYKMCAEVAWYVDPTAQRHGVGGALFSAIEPTGRTDGATVFQMFTLATSPAFAGQVYRNAGFIDAGQAFLKVV